jgi:hypothetical protein
MFIKLKLGHVYSTTRLPLVHLRILWLQLGWPEKW